MEILVSAFVTFCSLVSAVFMAIVVVVIIATTVEALISKFEDE